MIAGSHTDWQQEVLAHVLWAGKDKTLASHRCAGRLLRLEGMNRAPIEIVTTSRRRRVSDVLVHEVSAIPPVDEWQYGAVPMTNPGRIALDLCGVLTWEESEAALEELLMRNIGSLARMRWQLQTFGGHGVRGSAFLGRFLSERPRGYVPLKSQLELRVRRTLQAARIREPLYEHPVRLSTGWIVHPDFCWPDKMTAIEAESYRWHGGRAAWERDIERYEALRRDGWTVIHITAKMLRGQRDLFIADVRSALI